ncbi:hypothetical protein QAD02_016705 [Eretmocerus hayati]|uniref:Uncharacterized protein n=1 Tax=Eretmocerus hayati TaxID=131215 RepID=A0ACC2PBU7_9HYME|nr:hypothetical protein QAD02_016705 [Eretmocerus hayati]
MSTATSYEGNGFVNAEKTRIRTDFDWFQGFQVLMVIWCIIIVHAYYSGDLTKWSNPMDSENRICGIDPQVISRPYLLAYNSESSMCWHECPLKDFSYEKLKLPDGAETKNPFNASNLQSEGLICHPGVNIQLANSWDQVDELVRLGRCAKSYRGSKNPPKNHRCSGSLNPEERILRVKIASHDDEWTRRLPILASEIGNHKFSIVFYIVMNVLLTLGAMKMMRRSTVRITYIVAIILFIAFIREFYKQYVGDVQEGSMNDVLFVLAFYLGILVIIICIVNYYWEYLILNCKIIQESFRIAKMSKSVLLIPLLQSIVFLVLLFLGVRASLCLSSIDFATYRVHLDQSESCTCPKELGYRNGSTCEPDTFEKRCYVKDPDNGCLFSGCLMHGRKMSSEGFVHFFNFLGLYWAYFFLVGFGDMILASAYVHWNSRSRSNSDPESIGDGAQDGETGAVASESERLITLKDGARIAGRYHLGTVAYGAAILPICAIIRYKLTLVKLGIKALRNFLQKIDKPFTAVILLTLKCVFDFIEHFMESITDRAYIVCAIHGYDLRSAAKSAYGLLTRNVERVVNVSKTTNIFLLVLTTMIARLTTLIAIPHYLALDDFTSYSILSLISLSSVAVTWFFMRTIDVAVNTASECFIEDYDTISKQSSEKPYFANEEISQLLQKQ